MSELKTNSMKPHSGTCEDIFACKKRVCFDREPDKIVSKPYAVKR